VQLNGAGIREQAEASWYSPKDATKCALAAPVARIINQHVQNLTPDRLAD
jgi:hypothetical protein